MTFLRSIWADQHRSWRSITVASQIAVAAGIAVIIVGVSAGWGPTRLPGAVLISLGGAGFGVIVGLSQPVRNQKWSRFNHWRVWIALISATVIALPAMIAMGSAAFGPLAGGHRAGGAALVAVGVLLGLLFLIATFMAAILAVVAVHDRVGSTSREGPGQERSA